MSVDVKLMITKNAIGAKLVGGEFAFTLHDEAGAPLLVARNDEKGVASFELSFEQAGTFTYQLEETDAPTGWSKDSKIYPVSITVSDSLDGLVANVSYPQGLPGFVGARSAESCGMIVFDELIFDAPGVYEYKIRETSMPGGGWVIDDRVYRVVITVEDDGHGNLMASIDYPDGFPEFENSYALEPVHVTISAVKIAVGKELTCGMFQFGLYDENGTLIQTAYNQ